MRIAALVCLIIVGFMLPPAARACSVVESYRTPTNFELVERADLILVARVIRGPADLDAVEAALEIEPVRILKGEVGNETPRILGATAWNGRPVPSMPTTLDRSHFSAGLGACIRLFYPVGGLVVAMFEQSADGLRQIGDPWARAVEDVEAPDGVWVRAIEEYLAIQREAAGPARRQAIERHRDALRARSDDMAAQAIAFDLDRYLGVLNNQRDTAGRWRIIDMPFEAGAAAGGPGTSTAAVLRCTAGDSVLHVEALGKDRVEPLSLTIDGRTYDVVGEHITRPAGQPVISGEVPLAPELLAVMRGASRSAALLVDGAPFHSAPPADALQKLALRCDALRTSPRQPSRQ